MITVRYGKLFVIYQRFHFTSDGFNKIISELTNEEFINQTFNHVVLGRREGQRELTKERMLEMLNAQELLPGREFKIF